MKVKFMPQNIELDIQPNQSVMKLAHENGVYIKSVCGGLPSCAECRVRLVEGEQNVLPPSQKELNLIGTGYFIDQRRLSCQLKCFGDVTVDLTEQVAKQATDGPKRPQGSKKDERETSYAVSGNLIQQDESLKQVAQDLASNPNAGSGRQQNRQRNNHGGGNRDGGGGGARHGQGGGRHQHQGGQRNDRNRNQQSAKSGGRDNRGPNSQRSNADRNQQQDNKKR